MTAVRAYVSCFLMFWCAGGGVRGYGGGQGNAYLYVGVSVIGEVVVVVVAAHLFIPRGGGSGQALGCYSSSGDRKG